MTFTDGWVVFNDATNWNSTYSLDYRTFTTDSTATDLAPAKKSLEGTAKPKDELDWLRERVSEVCDLGRLS